MSCDGHLAQEHLVLGRSMWRARLCLCTVRMPCLCVCPSVDQKPFHGSVMTPALQPSARVGAALSERPQRAKMGLLTCERPADAARVVVTCGVIVAGARARARRGIVQEESAPAENAIRRWRSMRAIARSIVHARCSAERGAATPRRRVRRAAVINAAEAPGTANPRRILPCRCTSLVPFGAQRIDPSWRSGQNAAGVYTPFPLFRFVQRRSSYASNSMGPVWLNGTSLSASAVVPSVVE
jgi:hypothetical protein